MGSARTAALAGITFAAAVAWTAGCRGREGEAHPAGREARAEVRAGSGAGSSGSGSGVVGSGSVGPSGVGSGSVGSTGGAGSLAACDTIDASLVANLLPGDLRSRLGASLGQELEDRLRAALISSCRRDAWTAEALACAAHPGQRMRDRCPGKLAPDAERRAQNALVTEAMSALAEAVAITTPPRQQRGPHPDFPTTALAGTDRLFTLDEPERGPPAPVDMFIPRAGLTWTSHAYCDLDATGPICAPAPTGSPGLWTWRVGRGDDLVVVESRRGARVEQTVVYELRRGQPFQRVGFDAYDHVEAALRFFPKQQYSGRKRTGANALAGCGRMAYKLDASGRTEELACLQWKGDPMLDTEGVARTRYVRDAAGFAIEELRYDLAGKSAAGADGVHQLLIERDAIGRPVAERYRDPDGKPVASTNGCFGRRLERDGRGGVTRRICLDAADREAAPPTSSASSEAYRLDANGCRLGVRFLSPAGDATTNHDGVHAMDLQVDERCAVTSRTCKDVYGRAKACTAGGPARYATSYDLYGNPVSTKHYEPNGATGRDPALHAFELHRTFDRLGNQLTQACYDPGGVAVTCPNTDFHEMRSRYDAAGRELDQVYYDTRGRPVDNYGSYKRTYKHDNYDHLVEATNLDERGHVTEAIGIAIRKDIFDTAHRRFGIVLYDRFGQPALNTGCFTGATCPPRPWHAARIVRRKDGTVEKNLFFDDEKKLIDVMYCSATPCFD